MASRPPAWIEIVDWHKFQHYTDRNPPWIKNYTRLLHDENYLSLPPGTRALLHGLWLEYASSHAQIPLDTGSIRARLRLRVTMRQLESLNDAGFIRFRASNTRVRARDRDRRTKAKDLKTTYEEPLEANASAVHDDEEPFDFDLEQINPRLREFP